MQTSATCCRCLAWRPASLQTSNGLCSSYMASDERWCYGDRGRHNAGAESLAYPTAAHLASLLRRAAVSRLACACEFGVCDAGSACLSSGRQAGSFNPLPLAATILPVDLSYVSTAHSFCTIQHKSPIVEELEDRLRALGEHRARAAAQRAEADKEEEERPANAAVKAAMGVIGRGGAMPGGRRPSTVLPTFEQLD